MKFILPLILLLIATCAHAVPPIINVGDDSYAINPQSLFDSRKTYVPSTVSTATYALNAGTLAGLTTSQIIAISTGLTPTPDLTAYLKRDQTSPQITTGTFNFDRIQFSTTVTNPAAPKGTLQWNEDDDTLEIGMGDAVQQIGQELPVIYVNKSGGLIKNGQPVAYKGTQGNRIAITLAQGNSDTTGMVLGVATIDIPNNEEGKVTVFGKVRKIPDVTLFGTGLTVGELWLATAPAGNYTSTQPDAPHHSDFIGYLVNTGNNQGEIDVNIIRHKTMNELSDINGTPLTTTGQFPVWDNTRKVFDFTGNSVDIGIATGTIASGLLASTNTWTGGSYFVGSSTFTDGFEIYSATPTLKLTNNEDNRSLTINRQYGLNDASFMNTIYRTNSARYALAFNGSQSLYNLGLLLENYIDRDLPFCFNFWLNAAQTDLTNGIYLFGNATPTEVGYNFYISNGKLGVKFGLASGASGLSPQFSPTIAASTWTMITVAYNGGNVSSTSWTCWVNGVAGGITGYNPANQNTTIVSTIKGNKSFALGSRKVGDITFSTFKIDEFIFRNSFPSTATVQGWYNGGAGIYSTVLDTTVTCGFHLDENGGDYIYCLINPASSGTLVGAKIPSITGKIVQPPYYETVKILESKNANEEYSGSTILGSSVSATTISGKQIDFSIQGSTVGSIGYDGNAMFNNIAISTSATLSATLVQATSAFILADGTYVNNAAAQFGLGLNDTYFPKSWYVQASTTVSATTLQANSYSTNISAKTSSATVSAIATPILTYTSSSTPNSIGVTIYSEQTQPAIYPVWRAFDRNRAWNGPYISMWNAYSIPCWIGYNFYQPTAISSYTVSGNGYTVGGSPSDWVFQGAMAASSNTWVTLDTRTNQASNFTKVGDSTTLVSYTIPAANVAQYSYYRLYVTASGGASTVGIAELQLINRPYYDYTGTFSNTVYAVANSTTPSYGLNSLFNGTTYQTVTSDLNVGIGTTAPAYKLDVRGTMWIGSSTVNGTSFEQDGTRVSVGAATMWDDLTFSATNSKRGALDKPDFDYTNLGLLFPQNDASEKIYISAQMPHAWSTGTMVMPHVHYIQTAVSTVTWKMDYAAYGIGQSTKTFTTLTAGATTFAYTAGNYMHQIAAFPSVTLPVGSGISTQIDIIVYRQDNTNIGDVLFKQFDIHYQKDTDGSREEYIK